jgi:hypothetical protein
MNPGAASILLFYIGTPGLKARPGPAFFICFLITAETHFSLINKGMRNILPGQLNLQYCNKFDTL